MSEGLQLLLRKTQGTNDTQSIVQLASGSSHRATPSWRAFKNPHNTAVSLKNVVTTLNQTFHLNDFFKFRGAGTSTKHETKLLGDLWKGKLHDLFTTPLRRVVLMQSRTTTSPRFLQNQKHWHRHKDMRACTIGPSNSPHQKQQLLPLCNLQLFCFFFF